MLFDADTNIRSNRDNLDLIKACLEKGSKAKELIHLACYNSKNEVVKYLLDQGFDVNERDEEGNTPLSCVFANPDLADMLKQKGGTK